MKLISFSPIHELAGGWESPLSARFVSEWAYTFELAHDQFMSWPVDIQNWLRRVRFGFEPAISNLILRDGSSEPFFFVQLLDHQAKELRQRMESVYEDVMTNLGRS